METCSYGVRFMKAREGICYYIVTASLILDRIIVTKKLGQVYMLFWGLNRLSHQLAKTLMVR